MARSCEVSVMNGVLESKCREPAVAYWLWGDQTPLYVCERHDEEIQGKDEWGKRVEVKRTRERTTTE